MRVIARSAGRADGLGRDVLSAREAYANGTDEQLLVIAHRENRIRRWKARSTVLRRLQVRTVPWALSSATGKLVRKPSSAASAAMDSALRRYVKRPSALARIRFAAHLDQVLLVE